MSSDLSSPQIVQQKTVSLEKGGVDPSAKKQPTLAEMFSGDKDALDLFLGFCFLVQRINTGGVNINALGALYNIKDRLVEQYDIEPSTLEFIVSAINDSSEMYRLFRKGSAEFAFVQNQLPGDYCKIMAEHMGEASGFELRLFLSGDVEADLKSVGALLDVFLNTHIVSILAMGDDTFSIEPVNPWRILHKSLSSKLVVPDNVVLIAFHHRQEKPCSFYAVKALITIKRWLMHRQPADEAVDIDNRVKERPTSEDELIDRESFLSIKPNFISFSEKRPYEATPINSNIVRVTDPESIEEEEVTDDVDEDTGKFGGLVSKTKSLSRIFKRNSKKPTKLKKHEGSTIRLVSYNGKWQTFLILPGL